VFQNIPTITRNLLTINVLAYLATLVMEGMGLDLAAWGGLHFFMASHFHLYQFLTYLFLHGSFMHLFFNMFALWMFGCVIEQVWGPRKFLVYYMACGIGAGLIQELAQFVNFYLTISGQDPSVGLVELFTIGQQLGQQLNGWSTIGASGAVYAILLAFGMTFPENRIFIFPLPIPVKAKWFVVGYAALELMMAITSPGDGVAHTAHLGGMLFGFFLIRYWQRHPSIDYDLNRGRQFFDNMKQRSASSFDWFGRMAKQNKKPADEGTTRDPRQADMEYNARKQQRQAEVDAILDKIRASGYDSLTKAEKQRLFEASRDK
jgi:membrane associated rhomboid family serine protease